MFYSNESDAGRPQGNEGRPAGEESTQPGMWGVPPAGGAGSQQEALHAQLTTPIKAVRGGCMRTVLPILLGALLCLLIGGLVGWGVGRGTAPVQTSPGAPGATGGSMTVEQVIAQDRQAVVQINVQKGQENAVGSGVIIDQQGDIVTNNHVVTGGQRFSVVLFDGTMLQAQLVGTDNADDIAVIKVTPPRKIYSITLGDSSRLQVGNQVLAIGNPLGITQTVTGGIVSALGRTVDEGQGGGTIVGAVQTDAAINPGNSGGALVDLHGNLVGIPTMVAIDPEFRTPANGVGFAIPSNRVKFIAPQLIKSGRVEHSGRSALGVSVATVDALVAAQAGLFVERGALIVRLTPGGPAAQAGLREGDVITRLSNATISNISDLSDALVSYDPGTTISVAVMRGTQALQVSVRLGELQIP
jgi:S1-C subfamily serine protease